MQQDLLSQGIELLVYGMGTVVVFLSLLVFATSAMSTIIERYFPEAPAPAAKPARAPVRTPEDDTELVAVIATAIRRHRARHPRD